MVGKGKGGVRRSSTRVPRQMQAATQKEDAIKFKGLMPFSDQGNVQVIRLHCTESKVVSDMEDVQAMSKVKLKHFLLGLNSKKAYAPVINKKSEAMKVILKAKCGLTQNSSGDATAIDSSCEGTCLYCVHFKTDVKAEQPVQIIQLLYKNPNSLSPEPIYSFLFGVCHMHRHEGNIEECKEFVRHLERKQLHYTYFKDAAAKQQKPRKRNQPAQRGNMARTGVAAAGESLLFSFSDDDENQQHGEGEEADEGSDEHDEGEEGEGEGEEEEEEEEEDEEEDSEAEGEDNKEGRREDEEEEDGDDNETRTDTRGSNKRKRGIDMEDLQNAAKRVVHLCEQLKHEDTKTSMRQLHEFQEKEKEWKARQQQLQKERDDAVERQKSLLQYKQSTIEKLKTLDKLQEDLNGLRNDGQTQMKELQKEKEAALERLKAAQQEKEETLAKLDNMETMKDELHMKHEAAESRLKAVQQEKEAALAQAKALQEEKEAALAQAKALQEEKEAALAQTKETAAALTEVKTLQEEKEAALAQVKNLQEEKEAALAQVQSLQAQNSESATVSDACLEVFNDESIRRWYNLKS
eukprot:762433-Hanusia_phi.AAC.6